MQLEHLRYFKVLAELEHYSKAAEVLNITQPSLSYAIRNIESELNVNLFEKSGRNVVLSLYGKYFLEYVNNALDQLEHGSTVVKELAKNNNHVISIGLTRSMAHSAFVPNMISKYIAVNQAFTTKFNFLIMHGTPNIISALNTQKIDFGICLGRHELTNIHQIRIFDRSLYAVVPPDHALASKKIITMDELSKYPLILLRESGLITKYVAAFFDEHHYVKNFLITDDPYHTLALVMNHMGVGLLPSYSYLTDMKLATLTVIDADIVDFSFHMTYCDGLIYKEPHLQFIDFLQKHYELT